MKIVWFGDVGAESGFGRIANEMCKRLVTAGHQLVGASITYDGMAPHGLPFFIASLAGHDIWGAVTNVINSFKPDLVISCQDFPYAQTLYRACRIDWSRTALLNITPIDGTPINADWLQLVDDIDGTMVISRFGVEAMRQAGKQVGLLHPGADAGTFRPMAREERDALRDKAGIGRDAFVLGMVAMNQGRKNIPATLEGFNEFAKDKPDARLLLNMEAVGPGGWDVPKLMREIGLDSSKVLFRADMEKRGVNGLRERYCLMDAHSVLSFREGFGLPLLESQACGVPALALDWCSGTEICGDGHGVLIPRGNRGRYGTWGGAQDYDPDMHAYVAALNRLYHEPDWRRSIGQAGLAWARQQTWDAAFGNLVDAIDGTMAHHKRDWSVFNANVDHRAGVRPAAPAAGVPAQPDGNSGRDADGNHSGGRRDAGVRPDDAADEAGALYP